MNWEALFCDRINYKSQITVKVNFNSKIKQHCIIGSKLNELRNKVKSIKVAHGNIENKKNENWSLGFIETLNMIAFLLHLL